MRLARAAPSLQGPAALFGAPGSLRRVVGLGLLALHGGCVPEPEPPALASVDPLWGYNGEVTTINLYGTGFYPDVVVDGFEPNAGEVEGAFEVWLETDPPVALGAVHALSFEQLRAQVPPGLEPGTWPLRVVTPTGQTGSGDVEFAVTDTRADHLEIKVERAAYEVGEYASLAIALLDPAGTVVPQELDVVLSSTGNSAEIQYKDDGLSGQVLDSGVLWGGLGADGRATIQLTSPVPDDILFIIAPAAADSPIRAASQLLSWEAGRLAALAVDLPATGMIAAAGESFEVTVTPLDALGNVLIDYTETVFMRESCGDWMASVPLDGPTMVSVSVETACEENRLLAYASGVGESRSDAFEVTAGEVDHYVVSVTSPEVTVGLVPAIVVIQAKDAWSNLTTGTVEALEFRDSAGGLERGAGEVYCLGSGGGQQICTAALVVAAEGVTLSVTDQAGRTGVSNPFDVLAGEPAGLIATVGDTDVVAGSSFPVLLGFLDAWGNSAPWGAAVPEFSDDTGSIVCAFERSASEGEYYGCTITIADPATEVRVAVDGLEALADVLNVINGEIARVDIEGLAASYVAGGSISVTLRAADAWGNPYLEQSDSTLLLRDSSGTWSPPTAELDSSGVVQTTGTVTSAGDGLRLFVSHYGVDVGQSSSFSVVSGEGQSLELVVPPWIEVDEVGEVEVVVRDAWLNVATTYEGSVEIVATNGLCDATTASGFVAGVAVAELVCAAPGLAEVLVAESGEGLLASSEVMDIVDLGCVDGPVAALSFAGRAEAVTCLESGEATVDVDAGASLGGAESIVLYHFDESDGAAVRTLVSSTSFSWDAVGIRRVRALVVDGEACGALAEAYAYVGEGTQPTGELLVDVADSTVSAGGATTVSFQARDCTQDLSPITTFWVRADLGELTGASATGGGLQVSTDATAEASLGWSFPTAYSGTATVTVVSTSAAGTASIAVDSDSARPTVVSVDPQGYTSRGVGLIEVRFSEPMLSATSDATIARISDASGSVVDFTWSWPDDQTLELVPAVALETGVTAWTVTLLSGATRDADGNRLDGAFSGTASDFTVWFGAVPIEVLPITSCTTDVLRFSPDGDVGLGEEADQVALIPTYSLGTPEDWELRVDDDSGVEVYVGRWSGAAAPTWDGRGLDGRVVDSGRYALRLYARDAWDNMSDVCEVFVTVGFAEELP